MLAVGPTSHYGTANSVSSMLGLGGGIVVREEHLAS
jgi:hypothetical protein